MAVVLKHKKVVNKPDGTDESVVRPSDWNEEHSIQLTGPALIGKHDLGNGEAEEILLSDDLKIENGQLKINIEGSLLSKEQANESYASKTLLNQLYLETTKTLNEFSEITLEQLEEFNAKISIKDKGIELKVNPKSLNFTGPGVTTTVDEDQVTVTIPGVNDSSSVVITNETTVSAVTTAVANSSAFVAYNDQACTEIEIDNTTGVDLDIQRNGVGDYITIRAGQIRRVVGISNSNQIGVRRNDYTRNVSQAVTITAKAYTSTEAFVGAIIGKVSIINGGGDTNLPNIACAGAELINTTAKIINWRVGNTSPYRQLRDSESVVVHGISNTNQIQVKAFDSVVGFKQDLQFEAFTSGLVKPLNQNRPARMIAADASIPLDDNFKPQDWPTPPFVEIGETNSQRKTLRAKDVIPLALFNTVANLVTNRAADFSDANSGEIIFGTSAVEYTQTNANQTVNMAVNSVLSSGIDLTSRDIHLTYSVPDNAGINFTTANAMISFKVQLFSSGSPTAVPADYHEIAVAPSAQGFLRPNGALLDAKTGGSIIKFGVPIERAVAVGAGAILTAVTWSRLVLQGGSAALANGAKFRPHRIDAVKKARTKAAIVFIFDDLYIGQYLNALPMLAKYNYPACIGLDTTVKLGSTGFLTAEQLRVLHQEHGWQIMPQVQGGGGATDSSISPELALRRMSRMKLALKALGIGDTEDFTVGSTSFTSGITGVSYFENLKVLKRLFRSATMFLNGNNGQLSPLSMPELVPFPSPYHIKRMNMNVTPAPYTLEQTWTGHVEQAESCKGVAVFGAHSEFDVSGSAFNTSFATFLETVRAKELAGTVEVLTMAQVVERAYI